MMSLSDEGFRVTDRRRRDALETPPPSSPSAPRPNAASEPPRAPSAERSLVGLFMMLGTEAVIALGDAPDPASGQQHRRNGLTSDHDPPHVEAERTARLGGDRRMRADGEPYRSREPSRRDHRRQWSEWRFLQEPADGCRPSQLDEILADEPQHSVSQWEVHGVEMA